MVECKKNFILDRISFFFSILICDQLQITEIGIYLKDLTPWCEQLGAKNKSRFTYHPRNLKKKKK